MTGFRLHTPSPLLPRVFGRRGASRARRQAGFTLIELMIVIVLIGISAALVAPAIGRSMAISRASRCQYDFARMLRRARGQAIGTGRAQLVNIATVGTDVQLDVYMGDSSSCARSSWGAIVGVATPVDTVWQSDYDTANNGVFVSVVTAGAAAPPRQICFEPDGDRFHRSTTTAAFIRSPGLIQLNINRHEGGVPVSAVPGERQVIIPQFGTPRVAR